ncbi:MAG: alpha-glucan family phosphorylase [Candidatus Heimdallarchaeota archaeon]
MTSHIPARLKYLEQLANNLLWVWHSPTRDLFKRLDHPTWVSTGHNPVRMLQLIPENRLRYIAEDPSFLKRYDAVIHRFERDLSFQDNWFKQTYPDHNSEQFAYISTEFGLHQSLNIYSGGLGVLSGDHVKESSDLGIPLVASGFVYPQGYFKQVMPRNGWQQAQYENIIFDQTPINPVTENGKDQLLVEINFPKPIWLRIWKLQVGRTPLILMDTDIPQNDPWNRGLSSRLYGGDQEMRIRQEIVLGFGAVRVLSYLGYNPTLFHLNEGHSAFVALELLRREIVDGGKSFDEAKSRVRERIIFTTHTPVPAGHDQFVFELVSKYFQNYWEDLGISRDEFLALGAFDWDQGHGSRFNMTALGIRFSRYQNAVSKHNTKVCREMWTQLYSSLGRKDYTPIQTITNGVHLPTWVCRPLQKLYSKHLDSWLTNHDQEGIWKSIDDISSKEIWEARLKARENMFRFIRERARWKRMEEGKDSRQTLAAGALLDPNTLTVGFARRFATYKRAGLVFQDLERLKKNLLDPYTPIQIIFAGKAHPADDPGKQVLQNVYNRVVDPSFGGRIAFIEDYDLQVAQYLVQGCDIWLNTPRRPMEASGTSGMKSGINGGINFSILDGWWKEAYDGSNGWSIGEDKDWDDPNAQDESDLVSLYTTLEKEIRPLFYRRNNNDVPEDWIDIMRNSIKTIAHYFSARRMMKQYAKIYLTR